MSNTERWLCCFIFRQNSLYNLRIHFLLVSIYSVVFCAFCLQLFFILILFEGSCLSVFTVSSILFLLTLIFTHLFIFNISKCHVVSHLDDRNKIATILVFELTVASRQRMTVKKECGSQWRPDVCTWGPHSGRLTREGRREKPNDWLGPQTKVETPSGQQK